MGKRGGPYSGTRIGNEMEMALGRIEKWQKESVAVMAHYDVSREATVRMLFNPDTIERATQAMDIVDPSTNCKQYPFYSAMDVTKRTVLLGINYAGLTMLPINERFVVAQNTILPLTLFIRDVERIYRQFEEVKAVLRWLNTNASLNAIRAYFPSVRLLCPHTFSEMVDTPSRYDEPHEINNWLQALRDAGTTVAAAQMLPGPPHREVSMWLTFQSTRVPVGEQSYPTDTMTFHF